MSGTTLNPLLRFMDEDINRQPEVNYLPRYGVIPNQAPPDTYTGTLPTNADVYGPTSLNMPHDYWTYKSLLRPGDPANYELLLRLMYLNRDNRRG